MQKNIRTNHTAPKSGKMMKTFKMRGLLALAKLKNHAASLLLITGLILPAIAYMLSLLLSKNSDLLQMVPMMGATETGIDDLLLPMLAALMFASGCWAIKRFFFSAFTPSLTAGQSYLLFRLKEDGKWHNASCFLIHQGKWWGYEKKDQQFKARGFVQRNNPLGTEYCVAIERAIAEKICTENNGRKFKTRDDYLNRFCRPALLMGPHPKGVVL